ncbi:MAG TPA: hypothetical protein VFO39_02255 [Candidatus Sulfotelmatobacter sp.]|nr:hypothetical protein [Candidatus Sulfotelmatobacter sp.]
MDDLDFDFLDVEFFADGTEPQPRGPTAEEMWQQIADPCYVSEFLRGQRALEKDRQTELVRRRQLAIINYQEFCRQNDRYYHSSDNCETMFSSIRNIKKTMSADFTSEWFQKVYEKLTEKGMLDAGMNRGFSRAEISKMDARTYRDKILHPLPAGIAKENDEIAAARVKPAFRPSDADKSEVLDAVRRNGRISLAWLKSIFPHLTSDECATVADSAGLQAAGVGVRRTWYA